MTPLTSDFNQQASSSSLSPKRRKRRKSAGSSITIRVTDKERAALEVEAGERTLSAYARSRLFGIKDHRGPDRRPSVDSVALARILAKLGQSDMAANLALIAAAARTGTIEAGPRTWAALDQAYSDLASIRRTLIRALGISPE